MAILPFLGLSKGRLASLLRVAGEASHGDTKQRRKLLGRNADVLVVIIASPL